MSDLTLLVIAKEPLPGRVKTRLAPDVGAQGAADLAAVCLAQTLDAVVATPARRRVLVLDGSPGPWVPAGVEVVAQGVGGLADRLAAAFADVDGPAFLVGMDTPQITPALLSVDLRPGGAVLGLADDGGFWGIGMHDPDPTVFDGVPMSTARTGAAQLDRLVKAGLTVTALPQLTDVDTISDARRVALSCPGSRFAGALARIDHPTALNVYDNALRTGRPLRLVARDGVLLPFALDRWAAPADSTDQVMLDRCVGATLDVGCGPGRLTAALARRGHQVLGVDIAAAAVERTASRGARAVRGSVFDRLPGEGCWDTVLLADGNVGIGGDPPALLARLRQIVRPGGLLIIETEQNDVDEVGSYELQAADGSVVSAPFRWARVGPLALQRQAAAAGLVVHEVWASAGRRFTSLRA